MQQGDKNTRFFYKFATQRRYQNTIWDITTDDGVILSSEADIKESTFHFFQSQFGPPEVEDMRNQFQILKYVPRFFSGAER